jgi:uncharacterized membrane protein
MTNRNTLVTAAVLVAVFLAGALVGAAVASTMTSAADAGAEAAARGGAADGPERDGRSGRRGGSGDGEHDRDGDRRRGPDYAVSRLLHEELDLDADQERRVEAVLERRRERAHEIFGETKARLRSQFDSTIDEIEGILTDPQAARFDTLLDRLKERRGWKEDGHDGGA